MGIVAGLARACRFIGTTGNQSENHNPTRKRGAAGSSLTRRVVNKATGSQHFGQSFRWLRVEETFPSSREPGYETAITVETTAFYA